MSRRREFLLKLTDEHSNRFCVLGRWFERKVFAVFFQGARMLVKELMLHDREVEESRTIFGLLSKGTLEELCTFSRPASVDFDQPATGHGFCAARIEPECCIETSLGGRKIAGACKHRA